MHLYNGHAKKNGVDMAKLAEQRRQAFDVKTTPMQQSHAVFLIDGVQHCEINLNQVAPDNKRALWEWLKTNQPGVADLIANDELFKAIKHTFDGVFKIQIPLLAAQQLGLRKCP